MSNLTLNPFDLLGEDGNARRRRALAAKPTIPAPAPVAKPAAAPAAKPAGQQQQGGQQKASTAKAAPLNNNAGPRNQNGAPRPPRPQGDNKVRGERRPPQQAGGAAAPRRDDLPAGERPNRPFNPNKGERRERPVGRGRQYDRKPGTGRPLTENKKGGAGKGNWGPEDGTDELKSTEVQKDETEKPTEEEVAAPAADEPEAPKEPETKSLDEYLAERKQKAAKVDAFKKREAGEGVDQSAWQEYVPLSKEEEGSADVPLKNKKKDKKEAAAEKVELDTNFHFAPIQGEDRPRRGGRGGERRPSGDRRPRDNNNRRGGRGAGRGAAPAAADASAPINPADFPALGGSAPKSAPAAAPAPVKA